MRFLMDLNWWALPFDVGYRSKKKYRLGYSAFIIRFLCFSVVITKE